MCMIIEKEFQFNYVAPKYGMVVVWCITFNKNIVLFLEKHYKIF